VTGIATRHLKVGDLAPDFELPALIGGVKKRFRLSEYRRKKNVLLAFYPLNWDEVSARQLRQYQAEAKRFAAADTIVATISVDSIMNTTAWEREIGPFDFILCSDFWPHGEVSRAYGVFQENGAAAGTSNRSVFLVDRNGAIQFRRIYDAVDVPALEEALGTVANL
jgi:peroxiredoxin